MQSLKNYIYVKKGLNFHPHAFSLMEGGEVSIQFILLIDTWIMASVLTFCNLHLQDTSKEDDTLILREPRYSNWKRG